MGKPKQTKPRAKRKTKQIFGGKRGLKRQDSTTQTADVGLFKTEEVVEVEETT